METGLVVVAGMTLATWVVLAVDAVMSVRYVRFIDQVALPGEAARAALPRVTIVVPARNEERNIRRAMRSVLALEYPDLEIVAVNDRSQDATGSILDELAGTDPRLRIEHVSELPVGWLGKNHALQRGAEMATGELILFTDADVVFEPTVLARAVTRVLEDGLDHLTIGADVHTPGLAVELFVAAFLICFVAYFRPWRMGDPASSATIGIGAFNLVRKEAYRGAGGHAAIALRPDDDLRLAVLMRDHGASQAFGAAGTMVGVEWYPGLREAIRGLEKNSLAAVDYRLWMLLVGAPLQLAAFVWPFVAVLVTGGPAWWLNVAIVAIMLGVTSALLQGGSLRWWSVFLLPLGVPLVVFAYLRAALVTYVRGGIRWRGTFYSLEQLRGSRPSSRSGAGSRPRSS